MRVLKKADANGKCNPILVKKGPGIFSCFYQGDNKPYDIPLTLIQQGVFNLTTERVLDGIQIRFDGDDPSQILEFNYSSTYHQDLTLENGAITETNGVANAAHGIRATYDHQVHFTGTPKVNPMVFSGTFYGGAGLSWEPSDANYVYVYSNAVSATTGRLDVVKGTVKLVQGASFTALGGLSVAPDAVFEVESGSGEGLAANALSLGSSSAKLKLPEGVTLAAYSASLAGNALSPGTYTGAEGAEGTPVDWIEGAVNVAGSTLFKAVDGGVAEFARKVKTDAEFRPQGNGRLIFRDTLSVGGTMYIASTASRGLVMDLYGTNNGFSHVFWTTLHYGRINTHVPYAISDYEGGYAQRFSIAPEFTLDLCGNDQKFGVLNSTGGTITSDEPAILHLVAKYEYHDYGDLGRTNLVAFTGAAGFSHEGKYTNRLNAVSSTVGTLQVTEGMLRLLPNAAWPNSTNCVVTGGTLAFEHSGALTTNTPIRVYGSGKLELAYEGTMTNGEFRLDGRRMSGTIGAPGSGAQHECANIIGPGLLYVEPQGLQLFIR